MDDIKKRKLEAEIKYKETLLEIENEEILKWYEKINDYFENQFGFKNHVNQETETYKNRKDLFDYVSFMKKYVDDSRALMEEIHDLKVDLGEEEDEY